MGGFQHNGQAIPGVPESVLRQTGALGRGPLAATPAPGALPANSSLGGMLQNSEAADFAKKVRGGTLSGALGSARDAMGGAFGKLKGMFGGGGGAPVPKFAEANAAYMMKFMEKSALDFSGLGKGLKGVAPKALSGASLGALAGGIGGALSTDERGEHSLGRTLAGAAGGGALGAAGGALHHNYGKMVKRTPDAGFVSNLGGALQSTGRQAQTLGRNVSEAIGGEASVAPKAA